MVEINEVLANLQKSNEGMVLGLGAIAEVLNKMDVRLTKADEEEDEEKRLAENEEEEKLLKSHVHGLVKEAMVSVLKELQGTDVDATGEKKVNGKDQWPMDKRPDAGDSEKAAKVDHDIETQQKPILAMEKHDVLTDEEKDKKGAEYPKVEDKYKDMPADMQKLLKENFELKKAIEDIKSSIPDIVKRESEDRLRKMGFREEKSLSAPVMKTFGVDEPLVKSEEAGDLTDQLAKLSYSTLRKMQIAKEMGNTEGLPLELIASKS